MLSRDRDLRDRLGYRGSALSSSDSGSAIDQASPTMPIAGRPPFLSIRTPAKRDRRSVMITVFGEGRGFRVVWLLEELGLPYRLRDVDLLAGVENDIEFLEINPA